MNSITPTGKYNRGGGGWNGANGSRDALPPQENVIAFVEGYGLVPKPEDNQVVPLSDGGSDKPLLDLIKGEIESAIAMGASGIALQFRKRVQGAPAVTSSATVGINFAVETLNPPVSDGLKVFTKKVHAPTSAGVFGALMGSLDAAQSAVINGTADNTAVSFQSLFQKDRVFVRLQHSAFGVLAEFSDVGEPLTILPVVQRPRPEKAGQPAPKAGTIGIRTIKTLYEGQGKAPKVGKGDLITMQGCYLEKDGTINMMYVNASADAAKLASGEAIVLPNMMISVPRVDSVPAGADPVQMAWAFDNLNAQELSNGLQPVDMIPLIRERVEQSLAHISENPGAPAFQLVLRQVGAAEKMDAIAADPNSRANFSIAMRQKLAPGQDKNTVDKKYVDPTVDDVMANFSRQLDVEHNLMFKDVIEGREAGWQVEYVEGICAHLTYFQIAGHRMNEHGVDLSKQFALYERDGGGAVVPTSNGLGEGAVQLVRISKADAPRAVYWASGVTRFGRGDGALSYHPADMPTPNMHPAHLAAARAMARENNTLKAAFYKESNAPSAQVSVMVDSDIPF